MAYTPRSIAVIQAQLIAKASNYPLLAPILPNSSKVSKWTNWTYIIAFCINSLEQIWAILQSDIENTVLIAAPETVQWIQAKSKLFQYNASVPQVVQINADYSISYPIINPQYQIVTQCAVIANGLGGLIIKVATGVPGSLAAIGSTQLTAFTSYLNEILGADITFSAISKNADVLAITANIYFNGQFNGSITGDMNNAINNYLASIPFNGIVKVSDLMNAMRSVAGCTDVLLTTVSATPDGGGTTNLVSAQQVQAPEYQTYAGYINAGALTFTFIIQNS